MDIKKLVAYGRDIPPLVEGLPPWRLDPAIEDLFKNEEWDLLSHLLLVAAGATARKVIMRLLELRVYDPLVVAACLRRTIRTQPQVISGGGAAARVFRDIDAEGQGTAGIPQEILEDMREMAEAAARAREAQMLRGESLDRGPMREFIINRLAERLPADTAAAEALLVIAQAAGWEETRRIAAMKIANSQPTLNRLAGELRTAELVRIAEAARLSATSAKIAALLAERLDELRNRGDTEALAFIAANHPDAEVRKRAETQ
ncbi:MAG: hypothetical protein N2512_12525 [Armatimonadetes bacterium]|nr:hypothetical protein [Armatimonadota bacterium]